MHWFALDFLRSAADRLQADALYHVARKRIPSHDGPVQVPLVALSGQCAWSMRSPTLPAPARTRAVRHSLAL